MSFNDLAGALIFKVGVAIFLSFWGGKLAKKMHLPNVSGYVIVGLFLGPSLGLVFKNYGGFITVADTQKLSFISELTVAFIAFSIGSEFTKKSVKKMGKSVFLMTLLESLFAIALVALAIYFIPQKNLEFTGKKKLAFALVMGTMAASTAPAATLMVMRQYKAYGPFSMRVVGITALDDIFGIVSFGLAIAAAKMIMGITGDMHIALLIFMPLIEIVGSVGIGLLFGFILVQLAKKYDKARDDIQILIISSIIIIVGLTKVLTSISHFSFSPLLASIVLGTMVANIAKKPKRTFDALNDVVSTFYVMFFTFAGASLDLKILTSVGIAGIAFIIARAVGKYLGAFIGAKLAKESNKVAYLTGLALLPQGGVSIGLLVMLFNEINDFYVAASTIIMVSLLFYETLGPVFSKIAIQKAGEIGGAERFMQGQEDPAEYSKEETTKKARHISRAKKTKLEDKQKGPNASCDEATGKDSVCEIKESKIVAVDGKDSLDIVSCDKATADDAICEIKEDKILVAEGKDKLNIVSCDKATVDDVICSVEDNKLETNVADLNIVPCDKATADDAICEIKSEPTSTEEVVELKTVYEEYSGIIEKVDDPKKGVVKTKKDKK